MAKGGTRDKIIEGACALFNERGYGAVTTAALAEHLGIAEGNLWYHFKTKQALLEAIGERFAERVEARLMLRPQGDPIVDYAEFLRVAMDEFRAFRFLYRDQHAYGDHVPLIRDHAPDWLERSAAQIEERLAALVDAGLLVWPRHGLRDLAVNATIIMRYGLDHYRELGEPTESGTGAVRKTLLRHLTLFDHALHPEARGRLYSAIADIQDLAAAA